MAKRLGDVSGADTRTVIGSRESKARVQDQTIIIVGGVDRAGFLVLGNLVRGLWTSRFGHRLRTGGLGTLGPQYKRRKLQESAAGPHGRGRTDMQVA